MSLSKVIRPYVVACLLLGMSGLVRAENVTLNLKNSDINAVITTVSKVTGRNFLVDPAAQTVTLADSVVLSGLREEKISLLGGGSLFQVEYDFVDLSSAPITSLEPFFTPVLKDYVLKIITKGDVF